MRRRSFARLTSAGCLATALVAAFAGGGTMSAAADGQAHTTVPVRSAQSGPSGPTAPTTVGMNVDVSRRRGAQSETAIAVDPTNANHLLAASNDLSRTSSFNNVYESNDGGATWQSAGFSINRFCYDPWLDFNANGDAFFAFECSGGFGATQWIGVKLAGQTQWFKTQFTNAGTFPDRDMVVVDTTSTSPFFNSVYVGYDDANAGNAAHVQYSRTGFGNWLQSPTINDTSAPTIGVNAAVAPDGTVYALWEDFQGQRLWVDRSTNGAANWQVDHVVTNFRIATQGFFISIPPQNIRGVLPMPFSTVAPAGTPNAGRLYVTYMDRSTTGPDTDVFVRISDNGGTNWSPEIKINDDAVGAWQFHPSIAVAPDGTLAVSFYDTRNDPSDEKTDRFVSFSTDGGVTWSANERVTTAMSDEVYSGVDGNQYGDYQNSDAGPLGTFALVWTDSRIMSPAFEEIAMAPATP